MFQEEQEGSAPLSPSVFLREGVVRIRTPSPALETSNTLMASSYPQYILMHTCAFVNRGWIREFER